MTTRDDRIKGTAAGQAIGDALGAPVEFGPAGSGRRSAAACSATRPGPGQMTPSS